MSELTIKFYQRQAGHNLLETILKHKTQNPNADITTWVKGYNGEVKVGKELKRLPDEYRVYHSLTLTNTDSDIDHLIVSKFGLVLINTKNFPGAKVHIEGSKVSYDNEIYADITYKLNSVAQYLADKLKVRLSSIKTALVIVCRDIIITGSPEVNLVSKPENIVEEILNIREVSYQDHELELIINAIESERTWGLTNGDSVSTVELIEKTKKYFNSAEDFTIKPGSARINDWQEKVAFKPRYTDANSDGRLLSKRQINILAVILAMLLFGLFGGHSNKNSSGSNTSSQKNGIPITSEPITSTYSPTISETNPATQESAPLPQAKDENPSALFPPVPESIKNTNLCGNLNDCAVGKKFFGVNGTVFYDAGKEMSWGRYLLFLNTSSVFYTENIYEICPNFKNTSEEFDTFKNTYKGGDKINDVVENNKFLIERCSAFSLKHGYKEPSQLLKSDWLTPTKQQTDLLVKYLSLISSPNVLDPDFNYFISSTYGSNGFKYSTTRKTAPVEGEQFAFIPVIALSELPKY